MPIPSSIVARTRWLALSVLALTGCEYWSNVTVIAQDDTPPIAGVRLYEFGGPVDATSWGAFNPVRLVIDDPNRSFAAVVAGWDPNGAQQVTMARELIVNCVNGAVGATQFFNLAPIVDSQGNQQPGDTVESGIWTGDVVNFNQITSCPPGLSIGWIEYIWTAETSNYSGLTDTHGWASIRYQP